MDGIEKIGSVTNESVLKHTKKSWLQWVTLLNKAGAHLWTHQQTVAYLNQKHKVKPWWQQLVTIGYQIYIGKRVAGRNLKGEFSITATKTIACTTSQLWKFLISEEGIRCWLKSYGHVKIAAGVEYEAENGVYGQIRTLKKGVRIRLTWMEMDWPKKSVVQVYMVPRGDKKSMLIIQHEQLVDGRLRHTLRDQWKSVLENIQNHFKIPTE